MFLWRVLFEFVLYYISAENLGNKDARRRETIVPEELQTWKEFFS